jgi:hypothetical protein
MVASLIIHFVEVVEGDILNIDAQYPSLAMGSFHCSTVMPVLLL